jgi:hypothetical protein
LQIGVDFRCLGFGQIGVLLVDGRFVGSLFDAEQQVAGFDHLSFGEIALLDEAGDPRDHIDLVDRHDAAEETAGLSHHTADHGRHGDRRRWRGGLGKRRANLRHQAQRGDG